MIAESFLAHGAEALSGGERQEIVLHVAAETLTSRSGDRCEIEDGPAIPIETARRLACDASLVAIFEDGGGEALESLAHGHTRPMRVDRVELPDLR